MPKPRRSPRWRPTTTPSTAQPGGRPTSPRSPTSRRRGAAASAGGRAADSSSAAAAAQRPGGGSSRGRRQQRRRRRRRRRHPRPPAAGLGCHEHQHGRLGLHPPTRVRRQLRRGQRRRVPVRVRDVERADRAALAGRGLPAGGAGRGRPQAVLRARLGALDHPLRLRAVRTDRRWRPGVPGPRIEDDTEQQPQRAVHNRPHTLRRQARTDDAFPLAVRGANAMAGARLHRAEPGGAERAPDEGRCRADPHCTRDGGGRHCCCRSSCTHVAVQQRSRLGAGDPPRGGQLAPGCRHAPCRAHQRQVDVLLPGAQGRTGWSPTPTQSRRPSRPPPSSRTWPSSRRSRPGEHHPGGMDADGHLRRGRSQRPVRRVLRDPRVERLRRLPDRRQRAAVGAAGLGGGARSEDRPTHREQCHGY